MRKKYPKDHLIVHYGVHFNSTPATPWYVNTYYDYVMTHNFRTKQAAEEFIANRKLIDGKVHINA